MNNSVIRNASWIIGARVAQALIGIVISLFTARFLGPSNYGLINYAASIVTFVSPVMYLGLTCILVQEIIDHPLSEGETLGTAMCLSFISSIVCILGVVTFVYFVNAGERITLIVCSLYSFLLIFQSLDLIQYWYQAKLLSKYSSIVSFCAYIVVAIYKCGLLISHKNVYWFALSAVFDYMLIAASLIIIYRKMGTSKLSFSLSAAKRMIKKSKYYIISNIMIVIFAQTDRIMLKLMVSDASTGYYSVAVTCAGMSSFIFSALIDSMRPSIFEAKKTNQSSYEHRILLLYNFVIYGSLLFSLVMTIFAPILIPVLYGSDYTPSISVLQIIVWYCSFSYLGGARDIWILAENKQRYLVMLNTLGACMNVVLNYFLIKLYREDGAAIASVATQFFTNIVFVYLYKPLRENAYLTFKAANPRLLFDSMKIVLNR